MDRSSDTLSGAGETSAPEQAPERRALAMLSGDRDSERMRLLLKTVGIACLIPRTLDELTDELARGAGLLLLTEDVLRGEKGASLARLLKGQPPWSALPLLVFTREKAEPGRDHDLGNAFANVTLVERPVRTRVLISIVRAALRDRERQYQIRDAMAERERHLSELKENEARLRFALSAGRLGSWDLDLDTNALSCSALFKTSFGRTGSDSLSRADVLASTHPEDRARVDEAFAHALENRVDYDVEYRTLWPDGSTHWIMVRGRLVEETPGRGRHVVGVSLDVTERRRAEEELALQAAQLREADRRKDEFLATLAHELRNPLAPIRTGLEVIRRAPEGPRAERARQMLDRQISHMVRLVDDLLDVSRITRGKVNLKLDLVEAHAVIDEAVELSRPLIERGQHHLEVSLPSEALWLMADSTRLAQVVSNLLNNAAKYTPAGGHISLVARRLAGDLVIDVKDNGIGIPTDKLNDVFELFSQVNRSLDRSQGGLGIGLALVRNLVDLHRGSIKATSEGPGRGSVFTVILPLAHDEGSAPHEIESERQPAPGGGRRILIVDDNVDAAEVLAMLLGVAGHELRTADSGRSALAEALTFRPEVVFLDIGLPDMDGYEVARRLRDHSEVKAATLIALTGWGTEEDKQRATEAGFDFHLTKPVDGGTVERILAGLSAPPA